MLKKIALGIVALIVIICIILLVLLMTDTAVIQATPMHESPVDYKIQTYTVPGPKEDMFTSSTQTLNAGTTIGISLYEKGYAEEPVHYTNQRENEKVIRGYDEHKLSNKHSEENNQYTHQRNKENVNHGDTKIATHENHPKK